MKTADLDGEYLQVMLARPVPPNGGEGRILIDKTYQDAKSYHSEGGMIVFDRPLGINRNAVALAQNLGLVPVFETARMYTGAIPPLRLERVFGVTTFELG